MKLAKASGTLGLVALAAIASQFAMADNAPGWYVGANVGQSRANIDDARITSGLLGSGFATTSITDDDRDTGFKLFGGYQFNKYLAVEGGYFDLGKFGFKATTIPPGMLSGDIKLRGLNLDLVGTLPITQKFSAFGRVGMNYGDARDSFTGTGAVQVLNPSPSQRQTNYKYGVGLQYAFTEALAMRVEAERYRINDAVGNKGDVDLYSVGLTYRFGAKTPAPAPRVEAAPEPVAEVVAPAPEPVAPPAPRFEKYTLSATELFGFDSANLRMPQPKLDEIANVLNKNRDINNVVITGYADRIGSPKYNQKLSERRAVAVKNYLVGKGIEANRLTAEGKGEANPVVVCTDKKRPALIKCLEPNRRVEVEHITIERRVQ
ncbi:MAG TPA: flagellar motor protein MotB [Oxalobacteraceae bacterium]|nr:flagellar motor protein MotB [Oxalobacteraceae bacterium]HCN90008.1 flagellar motor protein MotB [Oxalobacteraceae bacterium]